MPVALFPASDEIVDLLAAEASVSSSVIERPLCGWWPVLKERLNQFNRLDASGRITRTVTVLW